MVARHRNRVLSEPASLAFLPASLPPSRNTRAGGSHCSPARRVVAAGAAGKAATVWLFRLTTYRVMRSLPAAS